MPVTVPPSGRRESVPATTTPITTPAATPPVPPRRQPLQLALILVAAFMVVLDFSIVNVALPSIERELRMPADAVQWIVTGYAISFGGLLILGGRAADLFGRRRMFVAGLVAFSLASLAGGLAKDTALLIAARVVQGAGAAVVAPAALSLITTGFPEGPERTRAIGLYGAVSSVGFVAGQVLGGVLVQLTSWRAVFLVNVPVGLIAAALSPAVLGAAKASAAKASAAKASAAKASVATASAAGARAARVARRLDVRGALLITSAVTLLVLAVSQGVVLGWTSPLVIAAAVVAAVATAAFVRAEARHPEPLIRPALLHRRGLRDGTTLAFLLGLWNGGEMLVLSLYLQQVLHESPLFTGLVIAPQGVVGFVAGVFGPRLAGRIGVRRLLVLTAAAAAAGFLVLTQLPAAGYSPVLFVVTLIGFGTAGTALGSTVLASRGMADSDQGLVGGMINTSRQIGAAVGAALLPAVAEAVSRGGGVSGDRAAMFTAALAALAATVVAWRAARPVPVRAAGLSRTARVIRPALSSRTPYSTVEGRVGCGKEGSMGFEHILVERSGDFATITMNRPQRRNALSLAHMRELITAFGDVGNSDALGIVLAGAGPVFSSGHDLSEVAAGDLPQIRSLLTTCTELMTLMQAVPQPVVARVHGLATAAGCQLVATADLAVASEDAGFAAPGGKGGWFCHTPMVAIARNVGRKRAAELAMSGDVIDAHTALDWGLVNRVVPAAQLDSAVQDLLDRVTKGSAESKGIGKQALYAQIDLDQPKAYAYAVEVMAATSQLPEAREWMQAFLEKRKPNWDRGRP